MICGMYQDVAEVADVVMEEMILSGSQRMERG
jgi:hypothetical protein